jgi:hypothetical protein
MHALIRRHVRQSARVAPWSESYGEPINQEDLAGTLLTFSLLVLDGLRKIGAELADEEELGYLEVWYQVGKILGLEPELLPRRIDAAKTLAIRIGKRQFRPSAEGRALMHELVKVTNGMFPVPGYGLSIMHFFLDGAVFGVNLAEVLGLPPADWTRVLVRVRAAQKRFVLHWLNRVPGARRRRSAWSRYFTQQLILLENPDKNAPFEVPSGLASNWGLRRTS